MLQRLTVCKGALGASSCYTYMHVIQLHHTGTGRRNAAFGIIRVTSLSNRGENQRQLHRKKRSNCNPVTIVTTPPASLSPSIYPSSRQRHHSVATITTIGPPSPPNNIATTTITVTPLSSINVSTINTITYYHHITTTPPSPTNDTTNNTTTTTTITALP